MVEIDFHLLFEKYQTKEVYVCQMADDQHFLIDLYANELWEVRKSYPKKYYDKRRKEWFDFEPVEFICRTEQFGSPNGYFRIELKPIIKTILEGRVEGAIEQKEKDKIIFVHVEKVKNKERVRIVFADKTIQFFDL